MTRQVALPPTLRPRLISREAAAAYVCVSPTTFDEMVADGTMPRARQVRGRRVAWDVQQLDDAVDKLPLHGDDADQRLGDAGDTSWGDLDGKS